ncbi:4Fe-4S ferredoxin [Paracidovorax avenae]|uniref:ATP-binding protein n=1 Tax=Paracidovorax avenae TaxID=80867 RepID=UPI000D204177|nr:4Fe-4S binding protein [Paracidovorax avenae]AVS76613.1 4Fe-4S ferredoxin [Paracidovorax avenae]
MPPSAPKALPDINADRCTGCGRCVAVCAPHVLSLGTEGSPGREGAPSPPWGPKRSVLHDPAGCTGCALCAVHCPFDAIRMERARPR